MSDQKTSTEFQPAHATNSLVAAGAVLTVLYLPAVVPFLTAGQIAVLAPWLAAVVAILVLGIVTRLGFWMSAFCIVALIGIVLMVSPQIGAKSQKFEAACNDLQKHMTVDNKDAANAAAIFTAYGCRPRWR